MAPIGTLRHAVIKAAYMRQPALVYARMGESPVSEVLDRLQARGEQLSFLQVGAGDGRTLDPIFEYVKRNNWHGLLLEPVSSLFEQLVSNYAGLPVEFENVAIASRAETKPFFRVADVAGLPAWTRLLGSFSEEHVRAQAALVPEIADNIVAEQVQCETIDEVTRAHGIDAIDLLVIDTEGFDFEIIKLVDASRMDPDVIIFEHVHLSVSDQGAAIRFLRSRGYSILRGLGDTAAVRAEGEPLPRMGLTRCVA